MLKLLFRVVVTALSIEFEEEVQLESTNDNEFQITLVDYKFKMSKVLINKLKTHM